MYRVFWQGKTLVRTRRGPLPTHCHTSCFLVTNRVFFYVPFSSSHFYVPVSSSRVKNYTLWQVKDLLEQGSLGQRFHHYGSLLRLGQLVCPSCKIAQTLLKVFDFSPTQARMMQRKGSKVSLWVWAYIPLWPYLMHTRPIVYFWMINNCT